MFLSLTSLRVSPFYGFAPVSGFLGAQGPAFITILLFLVSKFLYDFKKLAAIYWFGDKVVE